MKHTLKSFIRALARNITKLVSKCVSIKSVTVCTVYLWVSRHKTVEIVVDLLEHKASVHQVETALQEDGEE